MPRKNNTAKRKDSKGRLLRTGEGQRKDGTYDYRYMDKDHKHRSIYAMTLEELRKKEAEMLICAAMGIDLTKGGITVIDLVERYVRQKRNVRYNTRTGCRFIPMDDNVMRSLHNILANRPKPSPVSHQKRGNGRRIT